MLGGAAARRHQRRRPADQGGRAADQAGLALRVRSHHRPAGLADSKRRPVPQTDVPGEKTSPTQPIPTKPPAYSRNGVIERRSDRLHAGAEGSRRSKSRSATGSARCSCRRWSASVEGPIGALTSGTLSGGVNWPGSAYDPETAHVLRARVQRVHRAARSRGAAEGILGSRLRDGHRRRQFRPILGGGEGDAADAPQARGAAPAAPTPPTPQPTPPAAARRAGSRRAAPARRRLAADRRRDGAGPVDRQAAVRHDHRASISTRAS